MKVLNVPQIHCQNCVKRISQALSQQGIKYEISAENKTVTIDEKDINATISVLDDLGFDAE
ncbi:MAG: heavy-metal-associated domain-containing protein [Oscillospiraceae bacterium]